MVIPCPPSGMDGLKLINDDSNCKALLSFFGYPNIRMTILISKGIREDHSILAFIQVRQTLP